MQPLLLTLCGKSVKTCDRNSGPPLGLASAIGKKNSEALVPRHLNHTPTDDTAALQLDAVAVEKEES
jgi:hypothetical protein